MKTFIITYVAAVCLMIAACDQKPSVAWVVRACENQGGQVTVNHQGHVGAVTCVLVGGEPIPSTPLPDTETKP